MSGVFEALGDPTRRRILEVTSAGEHTAGTIVAALQDEMTISQPAISQHLKVLRDAGLVRVRTDGRHRYYTIDAAGLDVAHAWLAQLADPIGTFAQPLDALATEVARGRRHRRSQRHAQASPPPDRRQDRPA